MNLGGIEIIRRTNNRKSKGIRDPLDILEFGRFSYRFYARFYMQELNPNLIDSISILVVFN